MLNNIRNSKSFLTLTILLSWLSATQFSGAFAARIIEVSQDFKTDVVLQRAGNSIVYCELHHDVDPVANCFGNNKKAVSMPIFGYLRLLEKHIDPNHVNFLKDSNKKIEALVAEDKVNKDRYNALQLEAGIILVRIEKQLSALYKEAEVYRKKQDATASSELQPAKQEKDRLLAAIASEPNEKDKSILLQKLSRIEELIVKIELKIAEYVGFKRAKLAEGEDLKASSGYLAALYKAESERPNPGPLNLVSRIKEEINSANNSLENRVNELFNEYLNVSSDKIAVFDFGQELSSILYGPFRTENVKMASTSGCHLSTVKAEQVSGNSYYIDFELSLELDDDAIVPFGDLEFESALQSATFSPEWTEGLLTKKGSLPAYLNKSKTIGYNIIGYVSWPRGSSMSFQDTMKSINFVGNYPGFLYASPMLNTKKSFDFACWAN